MASPLDSTMGIWLVCLFLASILYGVGLIQTYLYFHQWYTKDHWGVKSIVICLLIFETLHITFYFCGTYWALIDHFGDLPALAVITCCPKNLLTRLGLVWLKAQLLAGYLSAFLVQMYFAYCIYAREKHAIAMSRLTYMWSYAHPDRPWPEDRSRSPADWCRTRYHFVSVPSNAQIDVDGLPAQTVLSIKIGLFTLLDETKRITTLQAASALFLAIPNTFWFFLGLILSGKRLFANRTATLTVYMNSLLATLNTRQHIRERMQEESREWNSIHLRHLSNNPNSGNHAAQAAPENLPIDINIQLNSSYSEGKKSTFAMDMV
ncbi:hypothetical protein B0H11DRAFT_2426576 [Mycena galericulata]|nr:hypothetical protein B0H11DRAFT_2426576 [Mycena galericulata]